MMWAMVTLVSVVAASLSSRMLIAAVLEGRNPLSTGHHSVMALRVSRWYRIFSWGLVSILMFGILFQLFWQAAVPFLTQP